MKNFNYVAKFKYFVIAALVLVVVGLTVLGIFNFNKSSEYKKAYEVKITASEVFSNDNAVMKNTASKVFAESKVNPTSSKNVDDGRIIIYEFNSAVSEEVIVKLTTALEAADLTPSVDIEVKGYQTASYKNFTDAWWAILAVAILTVAMMIYIAIRYKWAAAFTSGICVVAYVLLAISLTAITRIPVTTAYVCVLAFGLVLALTMAVYNFTLVKEDLAQGTKEEKANRAFKSSFVKTMITLGSAVVIALALIIACSLAVKAIGLQIIICSVAATFTSLCLTNGLYAILKK